MGMFFFSSRRRHTRLQGDWSSDVCSSDLWPRRVTPEGSGSSSGGEARTSFTSRASSRTRSEERRVGKEGRSRWAPEHERKNKETSARSVIGDSTEVRRARSRTKRRREQHR